MPPSAEEQVRFLVNIQRLLDEGLFVASYKFALLLSLADLSIELWDDSGASLSISTSAIAERFIRYYWTQAIPYAGTSHSQVLRQNTGQQAAVLNAVCAVRSTHGDSLPAFMRNTGAWTTLVRSVATVERVMPLNFRP